MGYHACGDRSGSIIGQRAPAPTDRTGAQGAWRPMPRPDQAPESAGSIQITPAMRPVGAPRR